jgi:hypothetical protein
VLVDKLSNHPDILSWYHGFSSPKNMAPILPMSGQPDYAHENPLGLTSREYLTYASWKVSNPTENVDKLGAWFDTAKNMMPAEFASVALDRGPPSASLELTWVYGYESQRSRNNVMYDYRGRIVYPAGKYVILYSVGGNEQRVFGGHRDLVLCLAMHPKGAHAASGEGEAGARLLVWDVETFEVLFSCSYHRHGIVQTAFSCDGALVAAVGNGEVKCLSVHDWRSGDLVYTAPVNKRKCLSLIFLKGDNVVVAGEYYLCVWRYIL